MEKQDRLRQTGRGKTPEKLPVGPGTAILDNIGFKMAE